MRKIGTILAVCILIGTLTIGAVVGQRETNMFSSQVPIGLQLSCPGVTAKTLTYKGALTKFNLYVENLGGYEIKVNVNKEVSGDTGYFVTWLDKKGFTVDPWESNSEFNLYVLARFKPEPNRVEEIYITVTIKSGVYQDTTIFHVELTDGDYDDEPNNAGSTGDTSQTPELCSEDYYVSSKAMVASAERGV